MLLVAASCCDRAVGADRSAIARGACEREMVRASARFQVPLGVLYAVALTETGRRDGLKPLALNIEGASHYPRDLTEALRIIREAQRSNVTLIDVGCMQINMKFHRERFVSLAEMFDPRRNVEYGASYLRTLYAREANWTRAVARYHAGPGNLPAQHRYVCTVIRNMIAAGMGEWTPSSRSFCE
ncbi:MAG: transglycosylase SLT domain-containing protein [Rhodoblastus sp.]|nr:transglycosylase SLT domain-containing protein [Rhodoblastus sp.]